MTIGQKGVRSDTGVDPGRLQFDGLPVGDPRRPSLQYAGRHRPERRGAKSSSPTATPTPASISLPPRASSSSRGASPATAPDSSGCPTASGLTATTGCWWPTGRTTGCRLSPRRAEYITTWPSKLIGPALFYIDLRRCRIHPGAQRRAVQRAVAGGRNHHPVGFGAAPLLSRGVGRLQQRPLLRDARRVGPQPPGGQVPPPLGNAPGEQRARGTCRANAPLIYYWEWGCSSLGRALQWH